MKNNLFINFYTDKSEERTAELNFCFKENIKVFDNIIVFLNKEDVPNCLSLIANEFITQLKEQRSDLDKVSFFIQEERPTYDDYFKLISLSYGSFDNINVISNSDIIIPSDTLSILPKFINSSTCLALSRWDSKQMDNYTDGAILYDRPDSQDTWIFNGSASIVNNSAPFTLGLAGCDNAIAHIISKSGYNVINPSKTLKTYHVHLTEVRNYRTDKPVPPPYKLLTPTN